MAKTKAGAAKRLSRDELLGKLAYLRRFRLRYHQRVIEAVGDLVGHELKDAKAGHEAVREIVRRVQEALKAGEEVQRVREVKEQWHDAVELATHALLATDPVEMKQTDEDCWRYEQMAPVAEYKRRIGTQAGRAPIEKLQEERAGWQARLKRLRREGESFKSKSAAARALTFDILGTHHSKKAAKLVNRIRRGIDLRGVPGG